MPTSIVPSRTDIMAIVVAAFRDSGGLNAGTPLATASVPVSAEQPFAKARMTRRTPRLSSGTGYGVTPVTCGVSPSMTRARPPTMGRNVQPRKMYVGLARVMLGDTPHVTGVTPYPVPLESLGVLLV